MPQLSRRGVSMKVIAVASVLAFGLSPMPYQEWPANTLQEHARFEERVRDVQRRVGDDDPSVLLDRLEAATVDVETFSRSDVFWNVAALREVGRAGKVDMVPRLEALFDRVWELPFRNFHAPDRKGEVLDALTDAWLQLTGVAPDAEAAIAWVRRVLSASDASRIEKHAARRWLLGMAPRLKWPAALVDLAGDPSAAVRSAALDAMTPLYRDVPERAIDAYVGALDDQDPDVAGGVRSVLTRSPVGDRRWVEGLARYAARTRSKEGRAVALRAARLRGWDLVPGPRGFTLVARATPPRLTLSELERLPPAARVEAAGREWARDDLPGATKAMLWSPVSRAVAQSEAASSALVGLLHSETEDVRLYALNVVPPKVASIPLVDAVVELLGDPSVEVRRNATGRVHGGLSSAPALWRPRVERFIANSRDEDARARARRLLEASPVGGRPEHPKAGRP